MAKKYSTNSELMDARGQEKCWLMVHGNLWFLVYGFGKESRKDICY